MSVRILIGDTRERLKNLPDGSVHCCVTSPPYFGLRAYLPDGHADKHMEIGLEQTPAEFVAVMVEVFREVRRVMRPDATLWLNLGDSYSAGGNGGGALDAKQRTNVGSLVPPNHTPGFKPKNLLGIPWRVAFALQADGWYLRQDIIWAKPNPMPESVTDRCTKAHEYLFLLSKSARYHYDAEAIAEAVTESTVERLSQENLANQIGSDRVPGKTNGRMRAVPPRHAGLESSDRSGLDDVGRGGKRNRRSVWTVATQPFKEAHFATFPPDLIEPCIKAGCPKDCCAKCGAPVVRLTETTFTKLADRKPTRKAVQPGADMTDINSKNVMGYNTVTTLGWKPSCSCDAALARGTVLDPFGGAGTTGLVADRLQRDAILIELNPEYAEIARARLKADGSLFAEVA